MVQPWYNYIYCELWTQYQCCKTQGCCNQWVRLLPEHIDTAREVRTCITSEEHHTDVSAMREVRAHQTLICTESYLALDSHRGNELLLGAVAEASKANYALYVYVGCIWGRC